MVKERDSSQIKYLHIGIKNIVEGKGYEYVDSELVSEDGVSVLRILIDSLGGLNVKDCEIVSRVVGRWLDESDPGLPDRYMLQVSSPGVERPLSRLEDFIRFQGKKARVKLRVAEKDKMTLTGIIGQVSGLNILFDDEETGSADIDFENILKANLVFEMPGNSKPRKKDRKKRGQQ
ncbi:MAG TPA: ribosome maturation factor RimP [Synergistetes bacterium]|nr:ribosome maturation factor RimP [Synergistota bacterium]